MKGSALVIFKDDIPPKNKQWWDKFDTVVAPKGLEASVKQRGLSFVDIDELLMPGSIQEASDFVRKLSLIKSSGGERLVKMFTYKEYELWWMHYDDLMYRFCLPYTQYSGLMEYIKNFHKVYLYNPPFPDLFKIFLTAHNCDYFLESKFDRKVSPGVILQVIVSIPFLVWIKVRRPKLMLWSSDLFDPPRDHDFRMRFIYEELRKKGIKFVEFIRSMEKTSIVIKHAVARRRPVIYSFAISRLTFYLGNLLNKKYQRQLDSLNLSIKDNPLEKFQFDIATSYIRGMAGEIWSIRTMRFILKFIGIKTAVVPAALSRNFPEVLACKIEGIRTTGILHGASSKDYNVYDFMPEFDGQKSLSLDSYGLWSKWWREYYVINSKVYEPEQLHISGLMRPLPVTESQKNNKVSNSEEELTKVLFVSEQLAAPKEVVPYLLSLLNDKQLSVHVTFRSYRDGFENWLKNNRPDVLDKIDKEKILRGNIHESIAKCDVVVGSHSTAVLEAVLKPKPFVFFRTNKWGDYFELSSYEGDYKFFAENPEELIEHVKVSKKVPLDVLNNLQNRFFGDPHKNGSRWAVEQAESYL